LPELGDRIAAQLVRLHEQTGKPVTSSRKAGHLGWTRCSQHPKARSVLWFCSAPIVAPGQYGYRAPAAAC